MILAEREGFLLLYRPFKTATFIEEDADATGHQHPRQDGL